MTAATWEHGFAAAVDVSVTRCGSDVAARKMSKYLSVRPVAHQLHAAFAHGASVSKQCSLHTWRSVQVGMSSRSCCRLLMPNGLCLCFSLCLDNNVNGCIGSLLRRFSFHGTEKAEGLICSFDRDPNFYESSLSFLVELRT